MTKPVTCIIPARGGSKRLPNKNLREVHGVPLVVRAISTALLAGCDRVIVSTEDAEIAAVALSAGAEVHVRPHELASDTASSESVLVDACQSCDVSDGILVFAQCTSPLTLPRDVRGCVGVISANPLAVAVTVVPFHAPVWRDAGGKFIGVNHDPSQQRARSQDWIEFRETGALYAFDAGRFLTARHRFCGPVIPVYQRPWQGVDVDDEMDLAVANTLARLHDPTPDLSRFKLLVTDFDGCITNNLVHTDSLGRETVTCSKEDSTAFFMLRDAGIRVHVLTHEHDACVDARCSKLDLPVTKTREAKRLALFEIVNRYGVSMSEVCYLGNDLPDVEVMGLVGLSACPADATREAKDAADVVLDRDGGRGAVRALADMLIGGRRCST